MSALGIIVAAIIGCWILVLIFSGWVEESDRERERVRVAREKYSGDLAEKIINKTYWTGQTAEQLRDSLGPPEAIDVKLLKTRSREVWKYYGNGGRQYRLRVTLDDGLVVTWASQG